VLRAVAEPGRADTREAAIELPPRPRARRTRPLYPPPHDRADGAV